MFERPEQPDASTLSAAGRARRNAILAAAQAAGRRRRRVRLAGRSAGVLAVVVLCAWVGWQAREPVHAPTPVAVAQLKPGPAVKRPSEVSQVSPATNPVRPEIQITAICTDPSLVDAWRVPATPPNWTRLDDNGLLAALSAEGQSAALMIHEGRTVLWTANRPARN